MAENKTQATSNSVNEFLDKVEDAQRKQDCYTVSALMQEITGEPPVLWGPSIVGFDKYHYKYASGHEGDFMITGFSPRKQNLTLYIMAGFSKYDELMSKLGKYKTGKSCLYIKSLKDIDMVVLKELITESVNYMRTTNHIAGWKINLGTAASLGI